MTSIEWTHAPGFKGETWNPVIGCRHVAEGCRHCYAETMSKRLAAMGQKDYASILDAKGKFNGRAITRPETLAEPLHWKKPRMVFVNSMSDLFHEDVPFEFIAAVFGVMAACPQHTFQVLTKRPERALEFLEWIRRKSDGIAGDPLINALGWASLKLGDFGGNCAGANWPLKNVWLGVSIATQADADKNVPVLLKCPASVRFVSAEPLIEAVDLSLIGLELWTCLECGKQSTMPGGESQTFEFCEDEQVVKAGGLDWVIVGGESGPGARPCDIAWIRSIVKQCKSARVPVFVKQLGARAHGQTSGYLMVPLSDRKGGNPAEWPEDCRVREFPKSEAAHA